MKYEHMKRLKGPAFRQVTGVDVKTFDAMVQILKKEYLHIHEKHGRNRKLSMEDNLLMMLEYYKEYRTFECIGASYGLTKSVARKAIMWVEEVLVKSGFFTLPGKKTLSGINIEYEVIVVDTTETPIERPGKGQRKHYSGKKNDIQ